MDEAQFRQACNAEGYAVEKMECDAGFDNDMHTHEFSAYAMVLRGEFTVVREDGATTFGPGDSCKVAAGTLHSENAGTDGATLLIGRK